ncbi:aldo/keto reductase [Lactobacillus sp. Sy-1]|uniref:aldo/keto reductase n=1 Tax=Lactobacillus sp. Sy-1 TaxID=2109645 RepID=UPI001C5833B5|nr:aldo/keto reductase [Lactobacillus sp. Sy-1]MBW1605180.1 aldo/keto reductase [Lactobacillus sp. Sy-1]
MEGLTTTTKLNNGVEMPRLGMGVWKSDNTTAKHSVIEALKHGYRMIDVAKQYGNEAGTGEGIKEGLEALGMNRKDLFVTTKIFNGDQGYDSVLHAFEGQLKRLQLTYVDLLLIHWPVDGKYIDTWQAMEKLYHDGKVRAIGVSNFNNERMDDLLAHATVTPAVNQMEFNPVCQDVDIIKHDNHLGIQVEAWSPLGGGESLNNPEINKLAEKYGKSAAQVILRWDWQRGIVTIPKSSHEKRIVQNSDIFDFELSAEDVETINKLDQDKRSLTYNMFQWHNPDGAPDDVDKWDDSPVNYKD